MADTSSELSAKNSSPRPKSTDPLEQTMRGSEEFSQLEDEPNPENDPAVPHHQLEQAPQQFVSKNEFEYLSSLVNSMDTRLTSGLTRVGEEVQSLREEVRANSQKVDENSQKLDEVMTLLREFRSCQCGVSEKK